MFFRIKQYFAILTYHFNLLDSCAMHTISYVNKKDVYHNFWSGRFDDGKQGGVTHVAQANQELRVYIMEEKKGLK
jgi:hypothetical protein